MGTTERRERHKASLRQEILDAASRLFVEEGYERVTMRRIAERIEYSATTIYLHFKNKEELLQAVCEETFAQLAGRLERLQRSPATPIGRLRESLRTCIDFGAANPNQYTVTFLRPVPGEKRASFAYSVAGRTLDVLRLSVQACVESGDIKTPSADATVLALWAAVQGITSLMITEPALPSVSREAVVDHAIDTLIAGLKTPAAQLRTPVSAQSKKWDYFD